MNEGGNVEVVDDRMRKTWVIECDGMYFFGTVVIDM